MQSDVHYAALKAAARVAFGVAFLGGCSSAAQDGNDGVTSESAVKAPCHDASAPDAKKSCDAVIASAFPDAGPEQWVANNPGAASISAEAKACCTEKLTAKDAHASSVPYGWSCCSALDSWNNPDPTIAIACTPWGPPVPPAMKQRNADAAPPELGWV